MENKAQEAKKQIFILTLPPPPVVTAGPALCQGLEPPLKWGGGGREGIREEGEQLDHVS